MKKQIKTLPDADRMAVVLSSAKALYEEDAARGRKFVQPGDELPSWDNIPQEARVTYIRIAAENRTNCGKTLRVGRAAA